MFKLTRFSVSTRLILETIFTLESFAWRRSFPLNMNNFCSILDCNQESPSLSKKNWIYWFVLEIKTKTNSNRKLEFFQQILIWTHSPCGKPFASNNVNIALPSESRESENAKSRFSKWFHPFLNLLILANQSSDFFKKIPNRNFANQGKRFRCVAVSYITCLGI